MIASHRRLAKTFLATAAVIGTASASFALYILPEALPLWRRTTVSRPAPLDADAGVMDILSFRFRQASADLLTMDLEHLQRLFCLALVLVVVSAALFTAGWKLRAKR